MQKIDATFSLLVSGDFNVTHALQEFEKILRAFSLLVSGDFNVTDELLILPYAATEAFSLLVSGDFNVTKNLSGNYKASGYLSVS